MKSTLKAFIFAPLVLVATAHAAPTPVQTSQVFTCKLGNGFVTTVAKGKTPLEAKENARLLCGEKTIDLYAEKRGAISEDRVDDLALACVNLECE